MAKKKQRRKENANYFNNYKEILQEALEEDKERKKLGFSNLFEFAAYEVLLSSCKDKRTAMSVTRKISEIVKERNESSGLEDKDKFKKEDGYQYI